MTDQNTSAKKRIALSVRQFALPTPLKGSIELLSGFDDSQRRGQEIHQNIQNQRLKNFNHYQSEVKISHEFETEKYLFEVTGRMDGIFTEKFTDLNSDVVYRNVKIEEIKSSFNLKELKLKLDKNWDHPYTLQLLTYGYMYWKNNSFIPDLSFHLVSSRNFQSKDLKLHLDLEKYEQWLNLRLKELELEAELLEKRVQKRKKISQEISFPFNNPRPSQINFIETIEEGIRSKKRMLLQAPTGLGKTVGVIFPTLKEALTRGQRVIYLTPKNSQHLVAEEALVRFREKGHKLKTLTITAKAKLCMKNETICNPDYCEFAKDHYTKVGANNIQEILRKKRKLTASSFKRLAEKYEICPFEVQLDAAQDADMVICDYNYAFAPHSAFGRLAVSSFFEEGKPNLVIDEAHNLPSRAMAYFSPELSCESLINIRSDFSRLSQKFEKEAGDRLDRCLQIVQSCNLDSKSQTPSLIDPPAHLFLEQDDSLKEFLSRYLESDIEIERQDPIIRMCFYWSEFTAALEYVVGKEKEEFFTTFQPTYAGGKIKITCCDASIMLKDRYDEYQNVVGFSATLKPFSYYSRLSGLDSENLKTEEFKSPFPKENRKIIVIPQISSKYSDREKNYPKIAEAIAKISELKRGNYIAFFPSFEFLERVLQKFKAPNGFAVIRQERKMNLNEIQNILDHMKSEVAPSIIFAVQGGVFSEGVDYPGNMVIGAFIVGTPLPIFDLEREEMRKYYEKTYNAGFDYAYTYPAMTKSVQAAGRVIRSETDKGIIVLMDHRFINLNYAKSMPQDWFEENPRELTSNQILQDITYFWET